MKIQKATRKQIKLRLSVAGPSGTGKTYSSLKMAKPFGTICVIDTENRSASCYAGEVADFDVIEIGPPFHPDRLLEAIAMTHGIYDVTIVDSLSHFYFADGGILDLVGQYSKKYKGNSHAAWRDVTPIYNRMVEALIRCPNHLICTMRAKAEYLVSKDEKGKAVVEKHGMAPVMRDGLEYEFHVAMMLSHGHSAVIEKTRCTSLPVAIQDPGEELGLILRAWTEDGVDPAEQRRVAMAERLAQVEELELTLSGISERTARQDWQKEQLASLCSAIEAKSGDIKEILGPIKDGAADWPKWSDQHLGIWLQWLKKLTTERGKE